MWIKISKTWSEKETRNLRNEAKTFFAFSTDNCEYVTIRRVDYHRRCAILAQR